MILELKDVRCGYGAKVIVNNFSAKISSGDIFCILGPNGIGKTTLFKTILGLLPLMSGSIACGGKNMSELSVREHAKLLAYVPQVHTPAFDYAVYDVVAMGRTAHSGAFGKPGKKDLLIAHEMIERMGISYLRDRIYTELSGGERQMVMIARALAQEPAFIMMDEPTSNLDFGNQARVLQNINRLALDGIGIIMTTHAPDHVFQCQADVALMIDHNICLNGRFYEILNEKNLKDAYGIDVAVLEVAHRANRLYVCQPVLTECAREIAHNDAVR